MSAILLAEAGGASAEAGLVLIGFLLLSIVFLAFLTICILEMFFLARRVFRDQSPPLPVVVTISETRTQPTLEWRLITAKVLFAIGALLLGLAICLFIAPLFAAGGQPRNYGGDEAMTDGLKMCLGIVCALASAATLSIGLLWMTFTRPHPNRPI